MRIIAYVVAALLLFTGCAQDQPKEPVPTAKPSPTVTAPVPKMPNQARESSPEGAAAFIGYYIDLFNHAAATGNTAPMLALSAKCEACSKYANSFEAADSRGDHISGKLWDLKTRNLRIYDDSIDVLTTIQTIEKGQSTTHRIGFVVPTKPPYKVSEIFEGDSK